MSSHPSPNDAPAPEPARSINLGASNDSEADLFADHNREFVYDPDAVDGNPGEGEPPAEAFAYSEPRSVDSEPPEQPDLQAQLDEANRTIAEMQAAMSKNTEERKEIERMKLQLQAQLAQQQAPQPQPQSQQKPKVDSGKAASTGYVQEQVQAALAQQQAMFEARLMLMQAGITQQDVQDLLPKYPQLNQIGDPVQAAQYIIQAHKLETQSATETPKEESKPKSPSAPAEPVKTVASGSPKPATAPRESSAPAASEAQRWLKAYHEADNIKDKHERQKAKKRAYLALTAIQNKTKDPSMLNASTPFIQRS